MNSQFAMNSPFIPVRQEGLICVRVVEEVTHDDMTRTRRIDVCPFLHQIGCGPGVVNEDRWCSTDPNSNERVVIVLTPLLEYDPWFSFRKVKMIADYRKWKRARREFPSQ
jgi:hypothetical protein